MIGRPLQRALLRRAVATVPVDDQDTPEAAGRHTLQDIADHGQVGLDAEGDRAGKVAEVGGDAVGEHRKDRDAERLGGVERHTLRQDAVHGQAEVAVLLGAADGQHGAVVVTQVRLDLHPVHVRYSHEYSNFRALSLRGR
jgi:hypothetical protein